MFALSPLPVAPAEVQHAPSRTDRRSVCFAPTAPAARTPEESGTPVFAAPHDLGRRLVDSAHGCSLARCAGAVGQVVHAPRALPALAARGFVSKNSRRAGGSGAQSRPDRLRILRSGRLDAAGAPERGRGAEKGASAEKSQETQALGRSRRGLSTKIHVLCAGAGRPIAVERLIGRLKEYRRIATRYDNLAESFRALVVLGFIRIQTKTLLLDTAWCLTLSTDPSGALCQVSLRFGERNRPELCLDGSRENW